MKKKDGCVLSKSISGSPEWCYLCGLVIPKIADHRHPLYGTIDHVVPLSRGGAQSISNRKPAHHLCNRSKASFMIEEIPVEIRLLCQAQIKTKLIKMGIVVSRKDLAKARQRWAEIAFVKRPELSPGERHLWAIQKWEDDGGSTAFLLG